MKHLFFYFILMAGCILSSCGKKETPAPTPLTKTQLISAKTWRMTAATIRIGTNAPVDNLSGYPACEADNLYIYRANNTYEEDQGATKCSPNQSQIRLTGTWAFTTNETKLSITRGSGSIVDDFDLLELTATTLKTRMVDGNGTLDYTFTAQ